MAEHLRDGAEVHDTGGVHVSTPVSTFRFLWARPTAVESVRLGPSELTLRRLPRSVAGRSLGGRGGGGRRGRGGRATAVEDWARLVQRMRLAGQSDCWGTCGDERRARGDDDALEGGSGGEHA